MNKVLIAFLAILPMTAQADQAWVDAVDWYRFEYQASISSGERCNCAGKLVQLYEEVGSVSDVKEWATAEKSWCHIEIAEVCRRMGYSAKFCAEQGTTR